MKRFWLKQLIWMGILALPFLSYAQNPCLAILEEDFSDTLFPKVGWIADGVTRVTSAGAFLSAPAAASFGGHNGVLTLPVVNYPVAVNFALGRTTAANLKLMIVEVSITDAINGYVSVDTFDHDNTIVNGFTMFSIDLSAFANQPEVWIRFRKSSSTTSPWRLDDIQVCHAAPLPVSLISFTGTYLESGGINLKWLTSGESNNDFFRVLRSDGDGVFKPIGVVSGAGTTMKTTLYQFHDPQPSFPEACYQLMQVDFDGVKSYSPIICLQSSAYERLKVNGITGGKKGVSVSLNGSGSRLLRFSIVDMMGNVLYDKTNSGVGMEEYRLFVKLSAGIYVLVVSDRQEKITHKFSVDF